MSDRPNRIRFGACELWRIERRLFVGGQRASVGSRAFELLLTLIDHRERTVAKQELLDRVWPGQIVEEANLNVQVSALRKLLGPDAIATISGRGYRFAAEVSAAVGPLAGDAAPTEPPAMRRSAALPPSPKFARPDAAPLVPRPALLERLSASAAAVLWLHGPPGSGKSALAALHAERAGAPVLWFRVDRGDRDPAAFCESLRAALKTVRRSARRVPPVTDALRADVEAFARRFARGWLQALPSPVLLCFDDVQALAGADDAQRVLRAIAEELAAPARLLVTSRNPPDAAFERLQRSGGLQGIDAAALRLSDDEARALCRARGGAWEQLPRGWLQAVNGWAAGLVLLVDALRRHSTVLEQGPEAPATDPRAALFDYFAGELFDALPRARHDALCTLALLPVMTADNARGVSGSDEAFGAVLQLHARGCFVTRLPGTPPRYAFHDLLREHLLHEGERRMAPAERRPACERAADALAAEGHDEEAVRVLIGAQAWDAACRHLLTAAPRLLRGKQWFLIAELASLFPAAFRAREPWLGHWQGRVTNWRNDATARSLLEEALRGFRAAGRRDGEVLTLAALAESHYYECVSNLPLRRLAAELAPLRDEIGRLPDATQQLWCWGMLLYALINSSTDTALIAEAAQRTEALCAHAGDADERLRATALLLEHLQRSGHHEAAGALIEQTRALAEDEALGVVARVRWWLQIGHFGALLGAKAAWQGSARARAIAVAGGLLPRDYEGHFYNAEMNAAISARDLARARALAREMQPLMRPGHHLDLTYFALQRAQTALMAGAPENGLVFAEEALEEAALAGVPPSDWLLMAVCAAVAAIETGRFEQAEALLQQADGIAASAALPVMHYRLLMVRALAGLRRAEPAWAALLREALALAERHDLPLAFAWYEAGIVPLLAHALDHGIAADYVVRHIRRRRLPAPPQASARWPWPLRLRTLGGFELVGPDGAPLPATPAQRPVQLLLHLLAAGGEIAADAALQALWPGTARAADKNAFDNTLFRLRRLLGDADAVELNNGTLALNRRLVWWDVWAFERLAAALLAPGATPGGDDARRTAALLFELWRGSFLPAAPTHAPLLRQRQRLDDLFTRSGQALVAALVRGGDAPAATDAARRALLLAPLNEDIARQLMHLLMDGAEFSAARAVYRTLAEQLAATHGTRPAAATEALARAIADSGRAVGHRRF